MSLTSGHSQNITAQKIGASSNGQEVTVPCSGSPTQCNGGVSGGVRRWVYRGTVTLPSRQADWVFSYTLCCRNCVITTILNPCAANSLLYVEATLDNLNFQSNDSPRFSRLPVAYVCTGQTFRYNHGAIDSDGDSLVYELIAPKATRNSNVIFIPPYSASHPMASVPAMVLNASTGDFILTPTQIQVGVMAIRVKEYRQGQMIGSVIRDMQVHAQPCSNILPSVSGINGSGTFNRSACAGDTLRFQITSVDPDSSQVVSIACDVDIPGSMYSISNGARPSLFFEWVPSVASVRAEPYRFTVTVQDNACPYNGLQVYSFSINVDFPDFQVQTTPVSCADSSNGTASVVSVNSSNYVYSWNTGATTSSVQGLQPGTYTVTVYNSATGCSAEQAVFVQAATPFSADVVVSPASCPSASDASVQIVPQGGVAPIQTVWLADSIVLSAMPVSPGIYSLQLIDAAGCRFDTSVSIGFNYQLSLQPNVVHNRCKSDSSGSISLASLNGQSPYTYLWSNGESVSTVQGLLAGIYTVTVTDQAGCTSSLSVEVEEPSAALSITTAITPAKCRGDSTGRAELSLSGSQGGAIVQWSIGVYGTVLSGVPAGTYTASVTDSAGCTSATTVQIDEPLNRIAIASTVTDVACAGDSSGALVVTPTGGHPPYSIQWSDGRLGSTLRNLVAGVYHAVVIDSIGCSAGESIEVSQPVQPLNLHYAIVPSNCLEGLSGMISVTPSGGTTPYVFSWMHGAIDSYVSVPKGSYFLRVLDGKGCFIDQEFVVSDESKVLVLSEGDPQMCPGSSVKLSCSSSAHASYQWCFNGELLLGATASSFVTRAPGRYTVRIVSDCGAFESSPMEVSARIPPQVSISNDVVICSGESTSLAVSGGVYYRWYPEEGLDDVHSASVTCSPLASTLYTAVVSDEAGCTSSASVKVTVLCDEPEVSNGFSPNGDGRNDTFFIEGLEDYPENVIHIYNRWGTLVFKEKPYENAWDGKSNVRGVFMGQDLPSGTYFYILDLGMNSAPVQGFVYLKRD